MSKALIAGLGQTGVACARHLAQRGWQLTVTDSRAQPPGLAALRECAPAARLALGGLSVEALRGVDLVVASPGLSLSEPLFASARTAGIEIVGDIELFARAARAPVVGITGTNGKSTVTSLLGRMASRSGRRVRVGGNLGPPALELLQDEPADLYVLELSSFQLEATHSLQVIAAAVLNLSSDHADRYPDMQAYAAAKARLFRHCTTAIINADDEWVRSMPADGQKVVRFSLDPASDAEYVLGGADGNRQLQRHGKNLLPQSALKLAGLHNAANALAAVALGDVLGLPTEAMLDELQNFAGLPHRSQWVAEIRGVCYINDSKGTNVGATLAAVRGLEGTLVLIAGGDGKGQDFAPLRDVLRHRVRHIVLIGRDAAQLARALHGICPLEICDSLPAAVLAAARAAQPGDTVLMSPACASLDMFRDYAHRGDVFSDSVQGLAA